MNHGSDLVSRLADQFQNILKQYSEKLQSEMDSLKKSAGQWLDESRKELVDNTTENFNQGLLKEASEIFSQVNEAYKGKKRKQAGYVSVLNGLCATLNQRDALEKMLDTAANISDKCLLFLVKQGNMIGWSGRGYAENFLNNNFKSFSVSVEGDALARLVAEKQEIMLLQNSHFSEDEPCLTIPEFQAPGNFIVAPLRLFDTLTAILYIDGDSLIMDPVDAIHSTYYLMLASSMWLENLALRKGLGLEIGTSPVRVPDVQSNITSLILSESIEEEMEIVDHDLEEVEEPQPMFEEEVIEEEPEEIAPSIEEEFIEEMPVETPPLFEEELIEEDIADISSVTEEEVVEEDVEEGPSIIQEEMVEEDVTETPPIIEEELIEDDMADQLSMETDAGVMEELTAEPSVSEIFHKVEDEIETGPALTELESEEIIGFEEAEDKIETFEDDKPFQLTKDEEQLLEEAAAEMDEEALAEAMPVEESVEEVLWGHEEKVDLVEEVEKPEEAQEITLEDQAEPAVEAEFPPPLAMDEVLLPEDQESLASSSKETVFDIQAADILPEQEALPTLDEEEIVFEEKPLDELIGEVPPPVLEDTLIAEEPEELDAAPVAEDEPVVAPPPPLEGPIWETPEEEKLHNDARRFARLLVSEIKLYNEDAVAEGRMVKDLYKRLQRDIERSRDMYEKRVSEEVAVKVDCFHEELVRILGEGDLEKMGPDYPGPIIRS